MQELSKEQILKQENSRLQHQINERQYQINKRHQEIENEISRIENQINERDRDLDAEQGKRVKRTFFVLYGVVAFILLGIDLKNGINLSNMGVIQVIQEFFCKICLLGMCSGFISMAIMFISYYVLNYIHRGAMHRAETIAKLEGELSALKWYKRL